MTLAELLALWMPTQRWFAGKGLGVVRVEIEQVTELADHGRLRLLHVIARVIYTDDGGGELYQMPMAVRTEPVSGRNHVLIGEAEEGEIQGFVYDGLLDPAGHAVLLDHLRSGEQAGTIKFKALRTLEDVRGTPVTAEQSNTSIIYGDEYILKVFRQLAPGINPDLELTRTLADAGSSYVAAPLGWIECPLGGKDTTLAFLQEFLRTGTSGWLLALASIRDLYAEADLHPDEVGGDFASESERLGRATAQVHATLAETLQTRLGDAAEVRDLSQRLIGRLEAAMLAVPELAGQERALRAVYGRLAQRSGPIALQRIHGDFHLGQTLRTETGWTLFDFEGEPARSLSDRRALSSPLQDVAGVLRSFDYAARSMLLERPYQPTLAYRADEWSERNRDAFCDGYMAVAGADPRDESVLLLSYELDKAVYEAVYDARHRPSWVPIPLGAIARMAETVLLDNSPD